MHKITRNGTRREAPPSPLGRRAVHLGQQWRSPFSALLQSVSLCLFFVLFVLFACYIVVGLLCLYVFNVLFTMLAWARSCACPLLTGLRAERALPTLRLREVAVRPTSFSQQLIFLVIAIVIVTVTLTPIIVVVLFVRCVQH